MFWFFQVKLIVDHIFSILCAVDHFGSNCEIEFMVCLFDGHLDEKD